jgi:hypothetical protein
MACVADQDYCAALLDVALALAVDLGDERARGIEHAQTTRLGILLHKLRDAMRTENGDRSRRHFREVLDETRTFCAKALDHMGVVDDFMPDIDRRAERLERLFDDIDGPDHTRAETARLGEHHAHGCELSGATNETFDCII